MRKRISAFRLGPSIVLIVVLAVGRGHGRDFRILRQRDSSFCASQQTGCMRIDASLGTARSPTAIPGAGEDRPMAADKGVRFVVSSRAEIEEWLRAAVSMGADPEQARRQLLEGRVAEDGKTRYFIARANPENAGEKDLSLAARLGITEIVQKYLLRGDDPNQTAEDGTTPLMEAARLGNAEMTQLLLKSGAKPNVADSGRMTPLGYAAYSGDDSTVQMLLDAGADPHIPGLLSYAAERAGARIVQSFIELGLDVNERGRKGATPLIAAAIGRRCENLRVLISHGADVNARISGGRTALIYATTGQDWGEPADLGCVRALLEHGAEVNARDDTGWTALMGAAQCSGLDVVSLLLAAGASVNVRDAEGNTPLHLSKTSSNWKVAELLASRGAEE